MVSDAREKAVEELAATLHREHYRGACGRFADASAEDRRIYRNIALVTMQRLGLVAVDPEMIDALRRASSDVENVGGVLDFVAREKVRAVLADAILSQLGATP